MTISDDDFIHFYQNALLFLWREGPEYILWIAGWPDNEQDITWYNKTLAAIARMDFSGLITSTVDTKDVMNILTKTTDEDIWMQYNFELTDFGKELAEQFGIPEATEEIKHAIPGFRETLSRIFDEHGVGFDVELPYKSCVTAS